MTLTYERLHEVLNYTPFDGLFRWKIRKQNIQIGDIAGCKKSDGYIYIGIDNVGYMAHRLAHFYVYGYWSEYVIDHRFRIRDDNRIRKLREISKNCDLRNRGILSNNTSGITGVRWVKSKNKWVVDIGLNKQIHYLGLFKDFDEAVCTRLAAEQCLNWSNCDSTSTAYQYVQEMLGLSL